MSRAAGWLKHERVRTLHEAAGGAHAPLADLAGFSNEIGPARWDTILRAWRYYGQRGHLFEAPDPPTLARFRRRLWYWIEQSGPPKQRGWGG